MGDKLVRTTKIIQDETGVLSVRINTGKPSGMEDVVFSRYPNGQIWKTTYLPTGVSWEQIETDVQAAIIAQRKLLE